MIFIPKSAGENWLGRAKESGFQIKETEEEAGKESAVFVNMVDDVILACLKVTARFEKSMLSKEKSSGNSWGDQGYRAFRGRPYF